MCNPMQSQPQPEGPGGPCAPPFYRAPFRSFNTRISEEGSMRSIAYATDASERTEPGAQRQQSISDRLPKLNHLAASPNVGGVSKRAMHPILSVRRRQTDFAGSMQQQGQWLQQCLSSPGQAGPGPSSQPQFRFSLPSLAPRTTPDPKSSPTPPSDPEQPPAPRQLSTSLSFSPAKSQAPSFTAVPSPGKPALPGASGYTPLKASILTQVPAVPTDSLFLASPFMAQVRRTTLTSEPAAIPKNVAHPKAAAAAQPADPAAAESQEAEQPAAAGPPRPAAAADVAELHYELDADFEAEAAKQRRMSSAMYIKTPAGKERALDGTAVPTPAEAAEAEARLDEEDEYEDEERNWEPKESLLQWLDVNVAAMKKKGRVQ